MNPHDPSDALDARARAVHAASLDHLSPRVQAQLAQGRRAALGGAPQRARRGPLAWAGVATAGVAVALVLQLRPPSSTDVAPGSTAGTTATSPTTQPRRAVVDARLADVGDADAVAPDLSEDPQFYVWLGDTSPARME